MAEISKIPAREIEFKPGARLFWGKQNALRVLEVDREQNTAFSQKGGL